jgi:hypothetical protein
MTSPQKAKGSAWEREISTFLSSLYGASFCRVPNSGAYIGGSNVHRKKTLSENQTKGFKGDIIPPDSWCSFNAEAKSYKEFPYHQLLSGSCKQLDTWLDQLMDVADEHDLNILFVKITRKGSFVAVQSRYTWVTDQFMYYTSAKHGDWILVDFDHFFNHNKDLLKIYSSSNSLNNSDTKS